MKGAVRIINGWWQLSVGCCRWYARSIDDLARQYKNSPMRQA